MTFSGIGQRTDQRCLPRRDLPVQGTHQEDRPVQSRPPGSLDRSHQGNVSHHFYSSPKIKTPSVLRNM